MTTQSETSPRPAKLWMWILNIGLILLVTGAALPIMLVVEPRDISYKIVFTLGAAFVLLARLFMPGYKGSDLRLKRLSRLEGWSAVLFAAAAFFMWYNPAWGGTTDWIAFTLAGAFLQLYCNFMSGRRSKAK